MLSRSQIAFLMLVVLPAGYVALRFSFSPASTDVSFSLEKDKADKWKLLFKNAPHYVRALDIVPAKREEFLNRGTWLVLAYSIFSAPDTNCVDIALRSVAKLRNRGASISLGVRPIIDEAATRAWYPKYERHDRATPIWIIVRDGRLLGDKVFPLSAEEVIQWTENTLSGEQAAREVTVQEVKYDELAKYIKSQAGSVVLVSFWNTWSVPDLRGFARLIELDERYSERGLVVVSVCLDDNLEGQRHQVVLERLRKLKANITNFILDEPIEVWSQKLRTFCPPAYYVFDRDGKWKCFTFGEEPLDYEAMEKHVKRLVGK